MKFLLSILLLVSLNALAETKVFCPRIVDCTDNNCIMNGGTEPEWTITTINPPDAIYLLEGASGVPSYMTQQKGKCHYGSLFYGQLEVESKSNLFTDQLSMNWTNSGNQEFGCFTTNSDTNRCPFLKPD